MKFLLVAEIRKSLQFLKSYPLDFIGSSFSFILVILAIIFGVYKLGYKGNVVDLVVFPMALSLSGTPSSSLREDIAIGTFEQVFNSSYDIAEVLLCRSLVTFILSLPMTFIILLLAKMLIDSSINLFSFSLIILFTLINGISVGMVLAGLVIVYRKIDSLFNLMYLALLFEFVFISTRSLSLYKVIITILIPFGSIILVGLGKNLSNMIYLAAVLNTLIWIFLSYTLYTVMYNYSRKSGKLGWY
jgi:ABC-2 type transport system permease protein